MKTIDAKGRKCPEPLILTKKALVELETGGKMIILLDNETSKDNVLRFLEDNGISTALSESAGQFEIMVTKTREVLSSPRAEEYCLPRSDKKGNYSFVFKTERVVNDELGEMLTIGFFSTIKELELLPKSIILYHMGIRLALDDSPVLGQLKELEALGVGIILCGTCVDYYDVKARVSVGIISNAYDILTALSEADHLVYP